jgi:hypothetical protein
MAHFAQLDENNNVIAVIVVHNNELLVNGVESEAKGIAFLVLWSGGTHFGSKHLTTLVFVKITLVSDIPTTPTGMRLSHRSHFQAGHLTNKRANGFRQYPFPMMKNSIFGMNPHCRGLL